ncbi:MAG TPA: M3 family oligoendopeptidase [Tepidisphaeraceae bacterium]|jgi:oligoendopeptidase F|nr:M3 family oligoendopeptidase [Tepidisphaeraceae bacterium]
MVAAVAPVRTFVPNNVDPSDFAQLEPLYQKLLARDLLTAAEAERWLAEFSELTAVIDEYGSRRYIDKSCHTDNADYEKRYMQFVEEVEPKIKPLYFKLQKKFLESVGAKQLQGERYAILTRKWKADVELFRDENVPLETDVTKTVNEYDKISGAMMVQFRGKDYTMQQLARFTEEPDRAVREEAWRVSADRRMRDREAIESIFDRLLPLRAKIAQNAGMTDYRAYVWKAYKRFDYTPQDCLTFADAIAEACVPVVAKLDEQRKRDLKLETLRPWDLAVDPQNRPPLRPFAEDQVSMMVDKAKTIFERLSPELANDFESLRRNNNLDLQSRKGKQPGGYQISLEESKQPFIFMNAAGLQRDVETLLHEGGHAFHHLAATGEPLVFLRSAPMEFCEVASMSMELLGSEHFDVFYDEAANAARARRTMIEGIIRFFPWMATIDSFQHWIYTNPGHTPAERTAYWISLLNRFGSKVDWTGLESVREAMWQRQLHLFHAPFYYIEYGIAQLGALQLWMKSKEDPRRALANYRAALALGGTRPLPDLFKAAGISFDFSARTLGPLIKALSNELDELPV